MSAAWHAARGRGKFRVEAEARLIGDDLSVTIWGGTGPHIGAMAIAIPVPSLRDPNVTSATSSVFTRMGHKDDIIARREAERLARALQRTVVVIAGIHIDRATDPDIKKLSKAAADCVGELLDEIPPYTGEVKKD